MRHGLTAATVLALAALAACGLDEEGSSAADVGADPTAPEAVPAAGLPAGERLGADEDLLAEMHAPGREGASGARAVAAQAGRAAWERLAPELPPPDPLADLPPSPERRLEPVQRVTGDISPKSVVASGHGVQLAQNMMYRHTITAYDRDGELLATISDRVDLAEFGLAEEPTEVRGAPVEAAFTSDGAAAYVSNYAMYGPGYPSPGSDTCTPADGIDDSLVYRLDVDALAIDQVIPVGATPKFVAVTPDDALVLVTNWCSYDLSVVDAAAGEEVARVDLGRYPRGIAVDGDRGVAYVAVMGSTDVAVVDLDDLGVDWLRGIGGSPRHLVLDPDGQYLYATLNADGTVAKVDLEAGEVVARVATGPAPRTMDIAEDGGALYVVNYHGDTLSKVDTADMAVLQEVATDHRPIGVTHDGGSGDVWVANYSGSLQVFSDR